MYFYKKKKRNYEHGFEFTHRHKNTINNLKKEMFISIQYLDKTNHENREKQ